MSDEPAFEPALHAAERSPQRAAFGATKYFALSAAIESTLDPAIVAAEQRSVETAFRSAHCDTLVAAECGAQRAAHWQTVESAVRKAIDAAVQSAVQSAECTTHRTALGPPFKPAVV